MEHDPLEEFRAATPEERQLLNDLRETLAELDLHGPHADLTDRLAATRARLAEYGIPTDDL